VNAVDAYDANNVVLVGDSGKLYRSTNAADGAAANWSLIPTGTTNHLRGIQMLSDAIWVVIGDNETILRTTDAGQSWSGPKSLTKPTAQFTTPAVGFAVGSTTIDIEGTATDNGGIGVVKAQVGVQRALDQKFWTGSGWTTTQTWLDASSSDGWSTWAADQTIDSVASADAGPLLWARARDGLGTWGNAVSRTSGGFTKPTSAISLASSSIVVGYGANAKVSGALKSNGTGLAVPKTVVLKKGTAVVKTTTTGTGGAFSFDFLPSNVATAYTVAFATDDTYLGSSANVKVTPKASIGRPVAPTAKRYRYFTTYAYMWPKHSSGAGGSKLYFYKKNSAGTYKYYKSVTASTVNSSTYPTKSKVKVRTKLPAGKWRVRVRHADAGHAETYSTYDYFRVY